MHFMASEVDSIIGVIDYFSNDMLEIICSDVVDLKINRGWMVGCSLVNFEKHVEENGLILKIKNYMF